ncbi:hypothetical protein [Motilibacter deserti]|uniref:Uncharacterized protein n=1 Tax=Motilibacter deserti TaxID=2714956 RepID=A0ABX0H1X1_9ACTN|nr:hypothetical protein [Motilibacter deserti]NHC16341.1 hypothetical protein [Motilibacter deserti]
MTVGAARTEKDECRRYRPIEVSFDTRNALLDQEIGEDWESALQEQWRSNQANVRMGLLAEHGTIDGETKIENYRAMGPAPWSIAIEHNRLMRQIRSAFTQGDFYPALVGACALGERVFNQLILALREDYAAHPATTKRVRRQDTFTNWEAAIDVLEGWGVLDGDLAGTYMTLKDLRHASVHYDLNVDSGDREPALQAVLQVQRLIEGVFTPHGGPPRFIPEVSGASFFAREAEAIPLVKRIFLPRCALLSPAHRIYPSQGSAGWE